jgi:hypothetical protein
MRVVSRRAACRTRSSTCDNSSRRCVRRLLRSPEFPLAQPLPSTDSAAAAAAPALFAGFPGTTGQSDFPRPFIAVLLPWDSRRGPPHHPRRTDGGSPDSRARKDRSVHGVFDRAGSSCALRWRCSRCCLPRVPRRRHPGCPHFAARYPAHFSPCQRFAATSWSPTHDSGPMRFATPSSYGSSIRFSLPILIGAFGTYGRLGRVERK